MRHGAILALTLCFASAAAAAEVEVRSSIDAVTVYPDGATVTRVLRTDLASGDTTLVARDFPPSLDPASLRVEGLGVQGIVIGSIDARVPPSEQPATNPELEEKLQALRDRRDALQNEIEAAALRKRFIERFATSMPFGLGEKGEARPIAEWRQAFSAVTEEIAAVDAIAREARLKQRELEREIARIEAQLRGNPARKMEVRIDLASPQAGAATFRVSYTVRGARWAALYDARLDSGSRDRKPALELVRRASILQRTGEDWNNVTLTVSTVRTAKGGSAPDLRPLIVRLREERMRAGGAGDRAEKRPRVAEVAPAPSAAPSVEREAVVDVGGFQALFRIPGRVSVPSHEAGKTLRIASAAIEPELLVRAVPGVDETAFLEAGFKHAEEAPLLAGRVALYRDGVFVGQAAMPATQAEEQVRLGFGADEKVKVTRVAVRRTEGSSGIISSSKTDEREFKITVRNGHAQPVRIRIEDQLPVSETEEVTVELLASSTPPSERNAGDRRGVLAWTFEAKPGEAREIKLSWRLRWPADKAIVYRGASPR